MAELAVVIIVGCCPYVPRFLRNVKSRKAGSNDAVEKRFSIPPKPTGRFNTFDKYLSTKSGMANLEPIISEEHLEMHKYKGAGVESRKPCSDDGIVDK